MQTGDKTAEGVAMRLTVQDFSRKSARSHWQPPRLFSHVESFDFTSRDEYLKMRTLPIGPRGFRVVELISSGHFSLTTEFSRNTIIFPRSGVLNCSVGKKRTIATPREAVSFGPIRRKTTVCPDATGSYRSISIISPGKNASGMLRHGEWNVHRDQANMTSITFFLEYLFDELESGTSVLATSRALAAAESLISEYFDHFIHSPLEHFETRTAQSGRIVGLACDFVSAHYRDPISVPDIARACGVGARSLQKSFSRKLGLSPRQVLTTIRLERARLALERADQAATVAGIALDTGFCHLGRFARAYISLYGEYPSSTLTRVLRAS